MIAVLKSIAAELSALGINYHYAEYKDNPPKYPYWIGSYTAADGANEDGEIDISFILTGFFRGQTSLEAELEKSRIISRFRNGRRIADKGCAAVVFYSNSLDIPQDFGGLNKSEIYLTVKYWKGE